MQRVRRQRGQVLAASEHVFEGTLQGLCGVGFGGCLQRFGWWRIGRPVGPGTHAGQQRQRKCETVPGGAAQIGPQRVIGSGAALLGRRGHRRDAAIARKRLLHRRPGFTEEHIPIPRGPQASGQCLELRSDGADGGMGRAAPEHRQGRAQPAHCDAHLMHGFIRVAGGS